MVCVYAKLAPRYCEQLLCLLDAHEDCSARQELPWHGIFNCLFYEPSEQSLNGSRCFPVSGVQLMGVSHVIADGMVVA
jgi:hypothetical protein